MATLIRDKYEAHKAEVNAHFDRLRANGEELNRIFAEVYDMVGEVPIEVEDKCVSAACIFDDAEEIPEGFKGNKYVCTRRDDIVACFVDFIRTVYGVETLEEYLVTSPTPSPPTAKTTPREIIRAYLLGNFSADHCATYKKRPIYRLVDAGKKNGFKALFYMCRYLPDFRIGKRPRLRDYPSNGNIRVLDIHEPAS